MHTKKRHKTPIMDFGARLCMNFSGLAPFCHIFLSPSLCGGLSTESYFSRWNVTVVYCNSFICMIIVLVCLFAQTTHIRLLCFHTKVNQYQMSKRLAKAATSPRLLLIKKINLVTRTNWHFKKRFSIFKRKPQTMISAMNNRRRHECNLYLWHVLLAYMRSRKSRFIFI